MLCLDAVKHRKMASFSCHPANRRSGCQSRGPSKFEVRLGNYVAEEGKCLIIAAA